MKKTVFITIIIFIATVASFVIYWNITYIDDIVKQGKGYGFQIGDSKEVSYQKARKIFTDKEVYILYPLDSNNFGPHKKYNFGDNEYQLIADRDQWEFLFDEKYRDFIELTFKNRSLISIYRHRQKFELP